MNRVSVAESLLRRSEHADGCVSYRSPALDELGVPHLFTTRLGVGGGALDAGALDREQELWLARAAGAENARLARVHQVHGCGVRRVEADEPDPPEQADALVTERADRLLLVRTADCVPVLVTTADGRRVAAIHAGWRGLVAGVIPRALEALAPTRGLVAAIGPCLSLARFEVGPEVARAFADAGFAEVVHAGRGPSGRPHVDLRAAARLALARGGATRIDDTDRCTYEHGEELFSYRRDVTHGGASLGGRLGALIAPARG